MKSHALRQWRLLLCWASAHCGRGILWYCRGPEKTVCQGTVLAALKVTESAAPHWGINLASRLIFHLSRAAAAVPGWPRLDFVNDNPLITAQPGSHLSYTSMTQGLPSHVTVAKFCVAWRFRPETTVALSLDEFPYASFKESHSLPDHKVRATAPKTANCFCRLYM